MRLRFAPSPTGYLHIGGARTVLFNYILARQSSGTFILRIDDTDPERSKTEYEEDIKAQMKWLGFDYDEGPEVGGDYGPYRQSEKFDRYREVAEDLLSRGKAFLDDDGTIRLCYPEEPVVVKDLVSGVSEFKPTTLGPEPVILRADKTPTYHLASTVDDVDMKITHVIRGQDHLTNSAKHVIIFNAMGAEVPQFAHLPLLLGADGSKLSKRNAGGFVSVREYNDFLPEALLNFLLLLGWAPKDDKEIFSLEEMVELFDISRVRATPARYELDKLKWFNGQWIRKLEVSDLAKRTLPYTSDLLKAKGEAYWEAATADLRDSYSMLTDAKYFSELLVSEGLTITDEAKEFLSDPEVARESLQVLEAWAENLKELAVEGESLSAEDFSKLSNVVKKATGIKGKVLFKSIRLAVMLDVSGPELKHLAPHIEKRLLEQRAREAISAVSGLCS